MANQSASTSTNSADWHVGVLRLGDSAAEDWYVSGVYIESGTLTASVAGVASVEPAPLSEIQRFGQCEGPFSNTMFHLIARADFCVNSQHWCVLYCRVSCQINHVEN